MARADAGVAVLDEARALFDACHWRRCADLLSEADGSVPLDGDGLLLLGQAAFLTGDDERAVAALARAYQSSLDTGDVRGAARGALSCTLVLENADDPVRAGAWAARAEQLVERHGIDGGEAAWVLAHRAHVLLGEHRVDDALRIAREGERLGLGAREPDVVVLARATVAVALALRGERADAIRATDEVMLAVSSNETSPVVVGLGYCVSVAVCMLLQDVARARSWTATLDRWCSARPDLVAYRGTCLVHRAHVSTLGGDWAAALAEAAAAEALLRGAAAGQAAYQHGELHRLMGRAREAEDCYRRANSLGVQPEPGLSRLRIAQGRPETAATTLRRLCREPRPPAHRLELLAALAEAELARDDVPHARVAADELRRVAAELATPLPSALADQSEGAVLLAEGQPDLALAAARRAQERWAELDLPHACAQAQLLAGRCLQAMGDPASAAWEFEVARDCFERLGAAADLAALPEPTGVRPGGLTEREVEVVRLVAAGHTNRAIAGRLCLSEKTVARHLANVYAKLDLPSRAAATAYAYDHGLV